MVKRTTWEIAIKVDKKIKEYSVYRNTCYTYSNKPEGSETENYSFEDVCEKKGYDIVPSGWFWKWISDVSGLKTGEKFCKIWNGDYDIVIHKDNLVSFKVVTTYEKDKSNNTLKYLMSQLPADEMIEYLKDNGLNVCPIAR